MANVIKLRKGLDINLKGKAKEKLVMAREGEFIALIPDSFTGVTPKVVVRDGDIVRAGDALFVNKHYPEVKFSSPVSGSVEAVLRGERRKVLAIKVKPDKEQVYVDFGKQDVSGADGESVINKLLDAGLFGYINQLPYAVSTNPSESPKAIFVSALRDKPLAADFEFELKGNERDFQTGLTALSRIAKTYLGIGIAQTSAALTQAKDVEINVFDGPCPAGNVGVQVNNTCKVNKGEVVWTVDAMAVIFFGRLFNTGRVDLRRKVAVVGSMVKEPQYVETIVGANIADIVSGNIRADRKTRLIGGNVLTGSAISTDDFLGAHVSEITAIPEGDDTDEMFGWIMPRFKQFSANRSYFSWLFGKREYDIDCRVKGGERHMIMSGEYDAVLPMDIYGEYLIKAILAGDIDRMEQLGIYEVAPEDFALAEFVDSSKLELQKIVREGLDMLRKENC
ncbi:MAG: Na(+)-translocating NADH-quinone reductase subunit A [Prevotella sp.]|uniref:Na(+)-translocating NADH-quinone reductase subunit A n=1 Tax=Prevotella sp. TaxID=59823 RepID=UPI002A272EC2|nr:Na(+)-translocating NADH-quinone reductase subunit A [Prevotella sp.]MDD7318214.1 Na(+)-translocating NADH-quinone reductase subunit A [Prevotellaceae bacterium]MDY4020897.1 Na(+)-translocating NADH-quinone reductase subunit A [Prevotella sp.]